MKGAENLSNVHPVFRAAVEYLAEECERRGLAPVVTEGYRSGARQDQLYAQGRTRPGEIVTNARAGQSAHNYGLAVDITSDYGYGSPQAKMIHRIAQALGFGTISWDEPHVEYPGWKGLLR